MTIAITRSDAMALGLKRYNTGKPCKHGHLSDRAVKGECIECRSRDPKRRERKKRYYREATSEEVEMRREKARSPERLAKVYAWGRTPSGCASMAVSKARFRAKKSGREFALDDYVQEITRVIEEGRCQLTGLPFDLEGKDKRFRPSLDRIDSDKGYTPDNVRVVLTCVNKMLLDYGEAFFLNMADAIRSNRALD
jgi:hypothetical protein